MRFFSVFSMEMHEKYQFIVCTLYKKFKFSCTGLKNFAICNKKH